jgi:hypothetical protein
MFPMLELCRVGSQRMARAALGSLHDGQEKGGYAARESGGQSPHSTAIYRVLAFFSMVAMPAISLAAETSANAPTAALALRFSDRDTAAWEVVSGEFDYSTLKLNSADRGTVAPKTTPLILEAPPSTGPRRLSALVRLRADQTHPGVTASFAVARKDDKQPGLRLTLNTNSAVDYVACHVEQDGKPLHDLAALEKQLDWHPVVSNDFLYWPRAYGLRDIRPGWPVDFRVRIEHDMARLPGLHDKWYTVRIECGPGEVRFWVDDRLVGIKRGENLQTDGASRIEMSPGVELLSLEQIACEPTPGFQTVRLDSYANASDFLGARVAAGALPPRLTIDGVPFEPPQLNAEGNDHIDVGQSLYRHANLEGYFPSSDVRWIGSARRDPARIQLRVPNGQFHTLYLLAAADGEPDSVPLVTAMFYRPSAGFAENFEGRVPLASAASADVTPFPVNLSDGKQANLWLVKIPLDPGRLSAFADMDAVEIELTKKVAQFRSYPDPFIYGWHQAGLPSSVHVFGLTLGKTPVGFEFSPDRFGHVWTAPETPAYTATLVNRDLAERQGVLTIATKSYDGAETHQDIRAIVLAPGTSEQVKFTLPVQLNGYHDIVATLAMGGKTWMERRSFVRLAPDTRAECWTEGKGALFGYWSYSGGHYTPKAEHHVELMTRAGARTAIGLTVKDHPLVKKHWTRVACGAWEVSPQPWAREANYDPTTYAKYQQQVIEAYTKARDALPQEFQPDHVTFFPEPHVSQRLTEGNLPTYWNAPEFTLTPEEETNLRMYLVTARCAAEAVRQKWPELKVLVPWGDPLFVPPLLRAGFPKNLIDGSGLDNPGFERLPEMQLHQICLHRLYELKKEFARAGIEQPRLQYMEGIFVPTEVGAVSYREQMDLYNRWALMSMAYGVTRFYSGWFAFDCGNYYGSEHYGGCGIQRRIPYCDPKPAYAAYATMTDKLDQANFDGWLPTGSHTNFCLRFKGPRGNVYALWNVRGKRLVTLNLAADGNVAVTDAMNNTRVVASKNKQATVITDPSVIYVTGVEVVSAMVGDADHSDVAPATNARPIADLADGTWALTSARDTTYENGTFAVQRFPGKFASEITDDPVHRKVLSSTLDKQETEHELMPWYNILAPTSPATIAGAPSHLGLWVKGASDWGRVIYVLRDAQGEKWTSIGTQDQYNCDDVHSASAFNFDGWRYVRFELPGHTGYDSFRKHGTTWWRSDGGDGIVDLPLALSQIIVEQRSHMLYVNDVQAIASASVCFGRLYAEYAAADDATDEAVRISRLRMPLPQGVPELPNPIAELSASGVGPATAIRRLEAPLEHNDGTSTQVFFDETPAAKQYFVWVSAHADGRGAVNLTPGGAKPGSLVGGLRPGLPFYFWVTYVDEQGKSSKPSAVVSATLKDTFAEK